MRKWFGRVFKTIASILALIVAVVLFFWLQADFRESETRHDAAPSAGRFVQAGDVEMFVQEMGPEDGQVIVFIHGTAAWSGLWLETMAPLAEAGYRCIALDIPPFGFSEKPTSPSYGNEAQANRIIALLDALDVQRAVLVGHSFGGGATMETALKIPNRIDALILLAVGGLNLNLQPESEDEETSALEMFLSTPALRNPVLATIAMNPLLTKKVFSRIVLDPADVTAERVKILQQPLVLQDATNTFGEWLNYAVTVEEESLTSDPANYSTLTMPTLINWGVDDTIIPLSEGEYLHSILPNSQLFLMEGINHISYVEENEEFVEMMLEFLQKQINAVN